MEAPREDTPLGDYTLQVRIKGEDEVRLATLLGPSTAVAVFERERMIEDALWGHALITQFSTSESLGVRAIYPDPELGVMLIRLDGEFRAEIPARAQAEPGQTWISGAAGGDILDGKVGQVLTHAPGTTANLLRLQFQSRLLPPPGTGAPVFVENALIGIVHSAPREFPEVLAIPIGALAAVETRAEAVWSSGQSSQNPSNTPSTRSLTGDPLFANLAPSVFVVLDHAVGMMTRMDQNRLHMEYLISALMVNEQGAFRAQMNAARVDTTTVREALREASKVRIPDQGSYPLKPVRSVPPYSGHVRDAFTAAQQIAQATNQGTVDEPHLLYGILSVSHCSAVQALGRIGLNRKGIGLRIPPRIEVPRVRADTIGGNDLLGLHREVDAIAGVLAAKAVAPPISVGLFGNWGSGKSFFMRELEKSIKEKADAAEKDADSLFCKDIYQLWFNAWHYMDTDLWASLASEIFERLAEKLDKKAAKAEGVLPPRERLLALASNTRDVLADAKRQRERAQVEVAESQRRLDSLNDTKAEIEKSLGAKVILREAYKIAAAQPGVEARLKEAAQRLNLPELEARATEVQVQLLELKGIWGWLRGAYLSIRNGGVFTWLFAGLLILAGVFVVPRVIGWLEQQGLSDMIAGTTAILGAVVTFVAPYLLKAGKVLGILKKIRSENQVVIEQKKANRKMEMLKERDANQQRLEEAETRVTESAAELKRVEEQIDAMRADKEMSTFILERSRSTDYTKQFGSIARARGDFKRLSDLMLRVNQEGPAPKGEDGTVKTQLPRIDRIVLYIDDLDRCPEAKVVQVLQAVHLLLAMDLFVVVVGVDSRWLLHSLRQHSMVFKKQHDENEAEEDREERARWQSTPLNYLEKIFQIPFTLRPMPQDGYNNLLDDLSKPSDAKAPLQPPTPPVGATVPATGGTTPAGVPAGQPVPAPAVGTGAQSTVTTPPAAPGGTPQPPSQPAGPTTRAQFLDLMDWELAFMKEMYPLIPSPRAAKRFVNVYRVLRATVQEDDFSEFVRQQAGSYRAVLLLLAMLTGHPAATTAVIRELRRRDESGYVVADDFDWWQFVTTPRPPVPDEVEAEQWTALQMDLESIRERLLDIGSIVQFRQWSDEVARYSFQAGSVLLEETMSGNDDGNEPAADGADEGRTIPSNGGGKKTTPRRRPRSVK